MPEPMLLGLSTGWMLAIAVAVLIVVVTLVSLWARRRRAAVWRELARRHGLAYDETRDRYGVRQPRIEGTLDGRPFRMRAVARGSDTDVLGATELVLEVGLRGPLPDALDVQKGGMAVDELRRRVQREVAGDAPGDAPGGAASDAASDAAGPRRAVPLRVDLGDEELASQLSVSASDPVQARAWLDERRRSALLALMRLPHAHGAGIRDGKLFVEERRLGTPAAELEGHVHELMAIAAALDEQPAPHAQVGA